MDLKNRIAVITGANKGIGLECAKLLLEEGSIVYGICRSSCDFAHSNFHIIQADVQVFEELEIAFNNILKQNDKIDILINETIENINIVDNTIKTNKKTYCFKNIMNIIFFCFWIFCYI